MVVYEKDAQNITKETCLNNEFFSHEMCNLMAFPMFALNLMLTTLSNGGPKKS
jgi:hypothetical protein